MGKERASNERGASRRLWAAVLAVAALTTTAAAGAQDAASGPMGQGEANINVRSDVRLAIKGTRATISERIDQLTEVVTDLMPDMRKCYRELVAKRPTTVGALAIRIKLDPPANAPPPHAVNGMYDLSNSLHTYESMQRNRPLVQVG